MKKCLPVVLTLLGLMAIGVGGYLYFFSGLFFCLSEDNCIQPRCMECRNMCVRHQCTFVQCKDHGTFDLEKGCICHEGYTGEYCEIKISE